MNKHVYMNDYVINYNLLTTYQRYLKIAKCLMMLEYETIEEDNKIIDEVIEGMNESIQFVDILAVEHTGEEQEYIFRHLLMTGGEMLDNIFRDWELGNQLLDKKVLHTFQTTHEKTNYAFADDWGMLPRINIANYMNQ